MNTDKPPSQPALSLCGDLSAPASALDSTIHDWLHKHYAAWDAAHPPSTNRPRRVVLAWGMVALSVVGGYPAPAYQRTSRGVNLPGATPSKLTQLSATATLSMSLSITSATNQAYELPAVHLGTSRPPPDQTFSVLRNATLCCVSSQFCSTK